MIPTYIGFAIAAVGLFLLWRGSVLAMLFFLIFCGLFGGAAALSLPALGGSSVPPVTFCLGFLVLRLLLPGSGHGHLIKQAFQANLFLLVFVLYGIVMAYAGPRLFGADIKVVPMRSFDTKIWATYPLAFSSQNITASVYLAGTFCCALCAFAACRLVGGGATLVSAGIAVVCVHMFFGITSVLFAHTPYTLFLDLFRNGNYDQLDQSISGFVRMGGIMPEPSAFAGYGFTWCVFLAECWYRDVRPRATGPLALAMMLTLLASTSSTAYVAVAGYAVIFFARMLLVPDGLRSEKLVVLTLLGMALAAIASATLLAFPGLVHQLGDILVQLTVNKRNSASGIQRAFWARQGLKAFSASSGMGIGPGSFRSSSILTAMLGATGLLGSLSFAAYLLAVVKPLRTSTYNRLFGTSDAIGVAAAWAAIGTLLPASVGSPTADPGTDFAIFAGSSLALRLRRHRQPRMAIALHARTEAARLAGPRRPALDRQVPGLSSHAC